MKKLMKRSIAVLLVAMMLLPLCACKKSQEISGAQALEVYVWDAGYGTEWLSKNLESFQQQAWVKEKHPNLQVKLVVNDQQSYAEGRITSGSANSIDLFFAPSLSGTFETYCLDLSEVLYNSEVPGEGILYKDKLQPYMLECYAYRDELGQPTGKYYSTTNASGLCSFVYNKTLFDEMGLSVPRTTDELVELCETVKNLGGKNPAYPYTTTIISSKIAYSDRLPQVWWAQYDGVEGYQNYYNAIAADGTRNSVDIFEEKGRLEAVKVFESLYKKNLGYYDRTSPNYEFIQGQTRMLTGEGLLMVCGEWFSAEMRDLAVKYEERGFDYDIGMMKLPVISSITDKTPTITDDAMLRQVISDIDAGLTAPSNTAVSAEDFATVRAARGVFSTRDSINNHVVIPNYSDAQGVAVDFLRYMATDTACAIYAEATYGGTTGFDFSIEEDAPELHQKLMQEYGKTYTVLNDVAHMLDVDYAQGVFASSPLSKYGNFTPWLSKHNNLESVFMSDPNITAEQIIAEHDKYWLDNNGKNFQTALSRAGLS